MESSLHSIILANCGVHFGTCLVEQKQEKWSLLHIILSLVQVMKKLVVVALLLMVLGISAMAADTSSSHDQLNRAVYVMGRRGFVGRDIRKGMVMLRAAAKGGPPPPTANTNRSYFVPSPPPQFT